VRQDWETETRYVAGQKLERGISEDAGPPIPSSGRKFTTEELGGGKKQKTKTPHGACEPELSLRGMLQAD